MYLQLPATGPASGYHCGFWISITVFKGNGDVRPLAGLQQSSIGQVQWRPPFFFIAGQHHPHADIAKQAGLLQGLECRPHDDIAALHIGHTRAPHIAIFQQLVVLKIAIQGKYRIKVTN